MSTRTSLVTLAVAIAIMMVAMPSRVPFSRSTRAVVMAAQPGRQSMQGMPMSMPDMKAMHEKMMSDMKTSQVTLDELAKKMNEATGDAKLNAMAALLTELVRQHRAMGEHMGSMHQHMMMGQMK